MANVTSQKPAGHQLAGFFSFKSRKDNKDSKDSKAFTVWLYCKDSKAKPVGQGA
jgi:hypothetical protein